MSTSAHTDVTRRIAYFSMEIGFSSAAPTYSGGLGVLAGDTLRAAADLGVPVVAVSLLYRKGYLRQHLDDQGGQTESPENWHPDSLVHRLDARTTVEIEGRTVHLCAWRYDVIGVSQRMVPIVFLDSDVAENDPRDRGLTSQLYAGDERYRLSQEIVLGLGGLAMLRALGYHELRSFHMNEGHSALLTVGLLREGLGSRNLPEVADIEAVREQCIFTTHTPVPAGHDRFAESLVKECLGEPTAGLLQQLECVEGELNMTFLALYFARYINGVSMTHESISKDMFPHYPIRSITNGVHAATWAAPAFRELYDRHVPNWREDNFNLRYAVRIPLDDIQSAHRESKRMLLEEVERRTGQLLDPNVLTIGFARRATPYKRAELIFNDLPRLRRIAKEVGPVQLLFAGKAHPHDGDGKEIIRRIFVAAEELRHHVTVIYLEQYDMNLGGCLTSGVDLWLNTPQKPQEASGTSGMKAALNGVPSLSVEDGWWVEGHIEGVTGWSIEDGVEVSDPVAEGRALYDKLEYVIVPTFYSRPRAWAEVMRGAIAINASFFNAQRMVQQYRDHAYALPDETS